MSIKQERPMRRSALISPWGVGAIVPFVNDESLMIAGLDMWRYKTTAPFIIKDERLQKRLGVKELRWPPDFRDYDSDSENCNLKIPAVRFPRWNYCPFCGTMQKVGLFTKQPRCDAYQWNQPYRRDCDASKRYRRSLIPERFVVVCPEGHIDDFPIAEWVHADSGHTYNENTCRIRRSTGGTSAALTGVRYECSCGASKSIAGALRPGALKSIGYKCKGGKPWLGIEEDTENPCKCDASELRVVQRGASNVWFADTKSSIYIPTEDESQTRRITEVVNQYFGLIVHRRLNGEIPFDLVEMIADTEQVDARTLYDAFKKKIDNIEGLPEVTEEMTEDEYRLAEYKMLIKNSGGDALDFHSINHPINMYHSKLRKYFKSITLVKKLRETRAFVGFSRLQPNTTCSIEEKKSMLRLGSGNWLPAIEVYGEGIFFEFSSDELKAWAKKESVIKRISPMEEAYQQSLFGKTTPGKIRPEYVLLHTFAHLIINQLSYECGYGSSSIKERIYCEKCSDDLEMYGVLIYTASGDSEGSLGGLVRRGAPGKIEDTIIAALENAKWCSSDPICITSLGQGPESLNRAACHNCALLPETCCECGNRLLDRGLVIGELETVETGYFYGL